MATTAPSASPALQAVGEGSREALRPRIHPVWCSSATPSPSGPSAPASVATVGTVGTTQGIFPKDGLPPVAATVFFGANDAALLGRSCKRNHIPVLEFKENLRAIVNHLKDCSKSMVILLITPPPVDEDGRERFARSLYGYDVGRLPERTNEMAGVYAGQCIELAKEMGVHCIDIWSKMQAAKVMDFI